MREWGNLGTNSSTTTEGHPQNPALEYLDICLSHYCIFVLVKDLLILFHVDLPPLAP